MTDQQEKSWNERLRQERIRRNWRQREVAEMLGTTTVTVTRWESGNHLPSAYFRVKLCALFGKSAQELGFAPRDLSASASEEGIAEGVSESIEIAPEEHTSADTLALAVQLSTEKLPETSSLQLPSPVESVRQKGSFVAPQLLKRRKALLLLGAGGLGVVAAASSAYWLTLQNTHSKQSSHLKVTTPLRVPLSQRLHHLFDVTISNWVNHLAWSPDNRYLAVASGTNNLVIWNIEKDVIALIYLTLNKWVNDVSWSKTNWVAAVTAEAGAGSLHLWKFLPSSSDYP